MAPIKTVSEVKDLYDLIDLYANLDRNGDGLLGPEEVRPEEVAAGDRGGIGSANHDVKDGFLSPWEVAQMRGFKWEDVRPLRIANQLHGRAFDDIEPPSREIMIGGFTFRSGETLELHPNGRVHRGILATPHQYDDITLPPGSSVLFHEGGALVAARTPAPFVYRGLEVPADTLIRFDDSDPLLIAPKQQPLKQDGITYGSCVPLNNIILPYRFGTMRTLAQSSIIPLFPSSESPVISLTPEDRLEFDMEGRLDHVTLASPTTIFGLTLSKESHITIVHRNTSQEGSHQRFAVTGNIFLGNIPLKRVDLDLDSGQRHGILASDATVRLENHAYTLKADTSVQFTATGDILSGELATSVPSPYRDHTIPAGTQVEFLPNGTLIEGSRECFQRVFPDIVLSGTPTHEGIQTIIKALLQLPPAVISEIKGVHSGAVVETPFRGNPSGYANPFNKTIYLKHDITISTVIHEAAHIHHLTLEDAYTKSIAAETRQLDLLDLNDQAANYRIAEQIIAKSIDGEWPLAAGYGFKYSIANLLDYLRQYERYEASALTTAPRTRDSKEVPHAGFISRYGRVSIWEDIATCVESLHIDTRQYRQLIDTNSAFYMEHPEQRPFAQIYRAKLDLLRKYRFITEAKYREIVPLHHPPLAAFCANLNCP